MKNTRHQNGAVNGGHLTSSVTFSGVHIDEMEEQTILPFDTKIVSVCRILEVTIQGYKHTIIGFLAGYPSSVNANAVG